MPGMNPRRFGLLILTLLLAIPAHGSVEVSWIAQTLSISSATEFEELTLTISGPGDFHLERTFSSGEPLAFDLLQKNRPLVDGTYAYEIDLQPKRSAKPMQRAEVPGAARAPSVPKTSGYFTVLDSKIVPSNLGEEIVRPKDVVFIDDVIVDRLCSGRDCVNNESFGDENLRLKNVNNRLLFLDTSLSPYPGNDWKLVANDSTSGGANRFSLEDVSAGRTPFTIEAGAIAHSLYVDDAGNIGNGTSTPGKSLHLERGDTPTLRLEQNGSAAFTPQSWDILGNEANLAVRDVGEGTLPFKIKPGAPEDSLVVGSNGNIGLGTVSPTAPLFLQRVDGTARAHIRDTFATSTTQLLRLEANGQPRFTMVNNAGDRTWHVQVTTSDDRMAWIDAGPASSSGNGEVMGLEPNGDLTIRGSLTANNGLSTFPDYVFEPDYALMPLEELEAFIQENHHLPKIPDAQTVQKHGLNMTEIQVKLVEKVEELTLYTIDQHKTIVSQQSMMDEQAQRLADQQAKIDEQRQRIDALTQRLDALATAFQH